MKAVIGNLFKRITNFSLAFVLAVSGVTAMGSVWAEKASAASVITSSVATLAADIASASPGDIIDIVTGGTISTQVIVNKPLTLTSSNNSTITVATTNAIGLRANDITVQNLNFVGPYNIGDAATTRALEVSSYDNITIQNNTFSNLRQPAYINDNVTGTIAGNYTTNTKGWVVLSNTDLTFTGNTWGTNVLDVAIIAGATNNYTDAEVVAISDNNNDAVVENQFGPTKRLSDAYVIPVANGNVGDEGSKWNPYTKVQQGLGRIVEGGTVHVADGSYTEALEVKVKGTKLVGESKGGTVVTSTGTTPSGHAVSVENVDNVSIKNMSFVIGTTGNPGYALKAYNTSNLVLENLDFSGRGNSYLPRTGGVDLNAVNGATITNVSAHDFSKNGFAVSSKYAVSDQTSQNISFNSISAANNAWAGVAFYTANNAGTVGDSITGVTFSGVNTILNNPKGIEIVGDSDANVLAEASPAYTVTGTGDVLDLGTTLFVGNVMNVINYQAANVIATAATFEGKTGADMTETERTNLGATIIDLNDFAFLGEVIFYVPVTDPGDDDDDTTTGGSGNEDDDEDEDDEETPSIITPIITNPGSVLGQDSDTDTTGESDVEGTTDDQTDNSEDKADQGTILGLAWYWWLLIIVGLAGIAWWLISFYRNRAAQQ